MNDRELIESSLVAYAAAFTAMDVAAVQRLHPSIDVSGLRRTFADLRWMKMGVDIRSVDVKGTSAVVEATVSQSFQAKAGSAQDRQYGAEFRMQKRGDTWIVADRR